MPEVKTSNGNTEKRAQDGSKKQSYKALLAVLYCCAFVAAFNENIVNVGLVDIMAEFSVSSITAQWLVTGYMAISAIVVSLVGFLLKRYSLRKLFIFGSSALALGSIVDIFAPTFSILLIARLAQALGTGLFISMMMNTVLTVAPRQKLGAYLAIGSCCITFGPAFGPVISGVMVTFFGWRSSFAVPAVCMILLLIVGIFTVRGIGEQQKEKLDISSVLLSAIGLAVLIFGLSYLTIRLALALICIVVGLAIVGVFAHRQLTLNHPVLNIKPLFQASFSLALIIVVVCMMTSFSLSVLLPLYFEGAGQTSALVAGLLLLIPILLNAVCALLGGRIMDKHGEWPLLPFGCLLMLLGMVLACLFADQINLPFIVGAAAIAYAGVGFVMSPAQTAGLKRLPAGMNPFGVSLINVFIMIAASMGPSLFVGIQSSTAATQVAQGAAETLAQAVGFTHAAIIGAVIAGIGLVIAFVYTKIVITRSHAGKAEGAE